MVSDMYEVRLVRWRWSLRWCWLVDYVRRIVDEGVQTYIYVVE
jgi:hypothetical protein